MAGIERAEKAFDVEYHVTAEDMLACRRFLKEDLRYRAFESVPTLIAGLMGIATFLCLLHFRAGLSWLTSALLASLFGWLLISWYPNHARRQARVGDRRLKNQYEQQLAEHFPRQARLQITPEGIRLARETAAELWPWDTVKRIDATDRHMFVLSSANQVVIVARRLFRSDEDFREFSRVVRQYHEEGRGSLPT